MVPFRVKRGSPTRHVLKCSPASFMCSGRNHMDGLMTKLFDLGVEIGQLGNSGRVNEALRSALERERRILHEIVSPRSASAKLDPSLSDRVSFAKAYWRGDMAAATKFANRFLETLNCATRFRLGRDGKLYVQLGDRSHSPEAQ